MDLNCRSLRPTKKRKAEITMICLVIATAALVLLTFGRLAAAYPPRPLFPLFTHAGGKLGAVASNDARCTRIGLDALRKGGSAADAVST
jgi:hypothetical protein